MRFFLAASVLFAADLLLAVLAPAREADAGTAVRLDLPELVARAELIVEARVLAAHPLESDGLLLTEYLLEVSRTFKGEDRSYRALRLPGGVREDGSGLLIPGVTHLAPGEEALLFLGPDAGGGMRMPIGLSQGRFRVERGPDGARRLVRELSSLGLVGGSGTAEAGRGRSLVDYAALVAAIEAAAGAPGGGR